MGRAVAAHDRYKGPAIVVDFGTAITYDVVSAAGEYLGGIITPGAEISIDALYDRAAKLPKVELAEPRALVFQNSGVTGAPITDTTPCTAASPLLVTRTGPPVRSLARKLR